MPDPCTLRLLASPDCESFLLVMSLLFLVVDPAIRDGATIQTNGEYHVE
jgi:hypothetical protein